MAIAAETVNKVSEKKKKRINDCEPRNEVRSAFTHHPSSRKVDPTNQPINLAWTPLSCKKQYKVALEREKSFQRTRLSCDRLSSLTTFSWYDCSRHDEPRYTNRVRSDAW